jgi:RNA polymerase sigma-70 factor (ECF subfamily)
MDKADFHALYERYARDVYRFALYLSGQRTQAEDIAAETFARAWTATDDIRTETVKAYLFAITRNLVRERLRENRRPTALADDAQAPGPDPSERTATRMELEAVLRALQLLPESDRAALLMRAQDDMSHEEIAAALGLSVAAVRVKIHRARLKLYECKIAEERRA